MDPRSIHELLRTWNRREPAPEPLQTAIYDELRRLAAWQMRGESAEHTLQPTALVHEAWMRLATSEADWKDRAHFFALAGRTMRRILVDHARGRHAVKRHGAAIRVELDEGRLPAAERARDLIQLDDALTALGQTDPRMGRIVELHYFAGLGYSEIAEALGVSEATVGRELKLARAWIRRELSGRRD